MFSRLSNSLFFRIIVAYVILGHLAQLALPTRAFALTGGPSQPDVQSFEPVGTSQMVSLPSGDFNYNIPLMDVEGYPINISYHSGSGLEDEASSVGLGWNLNIGVLNRQMRGIPDDFNGDEIEYEYNMRDNVTVGVTPGLNGELFGDKSIFNAFNGGEISSGVFLNNYRGIGFDFGVKTPTLKIAEIGGTSLTAGLDLNFNSQSGTSISPSLSLSTKEKDMKRADDGKPLNSYKMALNGSATFSARSGLKSISFSKSWSGKSVANDKAQKGGGSLGASISYGSQAFAPSISMPFITTSFSGQLTTGTQLFGLHPNLRLEGYTTAQILSVREKSVPSFGMMHLGDASSRDQKRGNFDFTREKDGAIIPYKETNSGKKFGTPNLPMANYTHDLYSASSQAVSGMFRIHRSEVGMLGDRLVENTTINLSGGAEIGGGIGGHTGGNFDVIGSVSGTKKWTNDKNLFAPNGNYRSSENLASADEEPYYFKLVGEPTIDTDGMRAQYGGDKPVQFALNQNRVQNQLVVENNNNNIIGLTQFRRTERAKRNTLMTTLTADEAQTVGLERIIRNYDKNSFYNGSGTMPHSTIQRVDPGNGRAEHHVSEITLTDGGGSRHIFGIPAYNLSQRDVTFAVSGNGKTADPNTHYIGYIPGTDNHRTQNTRGVDHYFQATNTPAYAYAYLLTGVVSPDYVDVTGDGITDDDLGTSYKFNYTRTHGDQDPFEWRSPATTAANTANYNQGFESKDGQNGDDKASYVYGTKEMWYPHSIESKHFVAEFYYIDSESGFGVSGENGGVDSNKKPEKLDKIVLYSKKERIEAAAQGISATPIKTVHFDYDYELCQNTPNSTQGGKLTLKEVYFTYGNSFRTRLSSYTFEYANNPDYVEKAQDIWGNYQLPVNGLPSWLFPYTDQANADQNAAAWNLSTIKTPSGGEIEVEYESKDYAYVQNLPAMDMFKVKGFAQGPTDPTEPYLFKHHSANKYTNNYLIVDLGTSVADDDAFKDKYLRSMKEMFVNMRLSVDNKNIGAALPDKYEQFGSYVKIEDGGMVTPNGTEAWILLDDIGLNGKEDGPNPINPIAFSAWNFVYSNLNEMIFPGANPNQTGVGALLAAAAAFSDVSFILKGFGESMRGREIATQCVPTKSWVRLYDGDGFVKGGGARVKQISMSDNWNNMSTETEQSYGQVYDYTITDDKGNTYSSGVASSIPQLGRNVNPLIMPKRYEQRNVLARNTPHEITGPVGESLMPGASIVHSQVKVTSIKPSNITRHGDGHVVQEYYTAKDYPVLFGETTIDAIYPGPKVKFSIGADLSEKHYTGSQGYSIVLNDMHGKPKASSVYGEGQTNPLSYVEYQYLEGETVESGDEANGKSSYKTLKNDNVTYVLPDGSTTTGEWGVDQDITVDARHHSSQTIGLGTSLNLEIMPIPFVPFFPSVWMKPKSHRSSMKTIVLTKVIRKHGLLKRVVAMEDGARVATENMAWDSETGQVLLTKTTNEFEDPSYSFSYPAYYAYDKMGPSYKNSNAQWENTTVTTACGSGKLVKGDELHVEFTKYVNSIPFPFNDRAWVLDPSQDAIIDRDGNLIDASQLCDNIKVIRSGRRNLQSASMGNVVAKENPISPDAKNITANKDVLTASAIEYHDIRQKPCGVPDLSSNCSCTMNPNGVAFFDLLNDLMNEPGQGNEKPWLSSTPIMLDSYGSYTSSGLPAILGGKNACGVFYTATQVRGANDKVKGLKIDLTRKCLGYEEQVCSFSLHVDPSSPFDMSFFEQISSLTAIQLENCLPADSFAVQARVTYDDCLNQPVDEWVALTGKTDCFPILDCEYTPIYSCAEVGGVVNPFVEGLRGNWSSKTSYTYLTGRTGPQANNTTDIRNKGKYVNFSSYWQNQSGNWTQNPNDWTWTATVTKHLSFGQELENKDPLDRFSAAVFGYKHQLPVAVGANSRYTEMAYTNFEVAEDIDQDCGTHFYFTDNTLDLEYGKAHSGNGYAKIEQGASLRSVQPIGYECEDLADVVPYTLDECDCAGVFSPGKGTYLMTYWRSTDIQEDLNIAFVPELMDGMDVSIKIDGQVIQPTNMETSNIIEGWQRVAVEFEVPGSAGKDIEIEFSNQAAGAGIKPNPEMYIDDLRIHPKDGAMKSYVYDHINLRLLAEGDDNNYYTFYQYAPDGSLMGVKRETERGIVSLQANQANASTVNK